MPEPPSDEARDDRPRLLAELGRLERASRPLDPGASRRRRLRTAAVASSERLLRRVGSLRAYVESKDKGAGHGDGKGHGHDHGGGGKD